MVAAGACPRRGGAAFGLALFRRKEDGFNGRSARLKEMNARVDHLLDEALGLPAEERSALAVALIDSLETADEATVPELWRAEARRRRAELRAGRTQASSWTEVRQRLGAL